MKKILVPCDFSGTATQAFELAAEIATMSKGEVLVLHTIEYAPAYETTFVAQPYVFNASAMEDLEKEAQKSFQAMIHSHPADLPNVGFFTDHGPITETITQFIDDNEIDLVVMGTHGATGLKEMFVGSNTERIVRFSHVPVLAIKTPTTVSSLRNIVVPTVPDLRQHDFVSKIKTLQRFLDARLHILYVNTAIDLQPDHDVRSALEEYVRYYEFENYTLNIVIGTDRQNTIMEFTQDIKADMIAMATHGRKGLSHFFSGSIAEDVVNHANCPTWTYALGHP